MPRRAYAQVRVFSDLPAAGGTLLGYADFAMLSDTTRLDGDDRLTGRIALQSPGASLITIGSCLEVTEPDGTVREWIVQVVRDDLVPDVLDVTALGARVWLKEHVVVRDGADFSITGTAPVDDALATLMATDEWPAWAVAGTITRTPSVAYTWTNTDGLAAVLSLVTASNAAEEVTLEGETVRFVFRRVSASEYAVDLITAAASGSPTIIEGKNLSSFAVREDRTQQVTTVYPVNAGGVGIGEAAFSVRSFDAGADTLELRDWAYRPDRLGVAYDGQWVGYYAVAPDGTAVEITDSWAATQEIEVTDVTAFGTQSVCRIALNGSGDAIVALVDETTARKRAEVLAGTWSAAINWLPNARFREWVSGTQVEDWAVSGGASVARSTAEPVTGLYTADLTTTAADQFLTGEVLELPHDIISPGGGSQTWELGFHGRRTSGSGGLFLQYSVNGGGAWNNVGSSLTATSYTTISGTFATNAATIPNLISVRFRSSSAGTSTFRIDRVWLFRDGVDDADTTLEGCGPSTGLYEGNRRLLLARNGGRTYEVGIIDRTRDDPTAFPDDTFAVAQNCRLIVPARAVDTTQQVVQVARDLMIPTNTTVQLGALRRRFTVNA
jgi:hypothetical protein